jgi:hypothetical protein
MGDGTETVDESLGHENQRNKKKQTTDQEGRRQNPAFQRLFGFHKSLLEQEV